MSNNFYQMGKEKVFQTLNTNELGLSQEEVNKRLKQYGKNELKEKSGKSGFKILLAQLTEVMVLILIVAAVVSFLLHEYLDATVILIIVVLNTVLGFTQEYRAEKAMAALKKLTVPDVRVLRDGITMEISTKELVPGDVLIFEAGNIIPADARLIKVFNLRIQESALTGESEPVTKDSQVLPEKELALGDRKNMIYMGTVATYGRGKAIVTKTGMQTQLGKIATMLQSVEDEETLLQKRLAKLGKTLALSALLLIVVVAVIQLLQHASWKITFMTAISMAVAAIPEGLPAVVTIALALGAQKMLKKNSLIRRLMAVETLGSITVICSDKTGTLTQNKMTVTKIVLPQKSYRMSSLIEIKNSYISQSIYLLLAAGALCNDAVIKKKLDAEEKQPLDNETLGDPTEGSLVIASQKMDLEKQDLEKAFKRIAELPFDSNRKRMTTLHQINKIGGDNQIKSLIDLLKQDEKNPYIAFAKGAVDGLILCCSKVLVKGQIQELTDEIKATILDENKKMAQNGIRVLGMAYRPAEEKFIKDTTNLEQDMIYIGMAGMIDPVRPEVKDAVDVCKQAGIRPIMITGDHPLTALFIAKQIGISSDDKVLTGQELSKMSKEELLKQSSEVNVYARVSPEHKMKLIDALQEQGQIVSMTGDGVNDAPALKSADIGVAMGITGTDVSKESSDMVLLDDNFATIVSAVKEGRTIYDNIKKFVKYIIAGNVGEIIVMLLGPLFGLPLPLMPIQILWINLVTDGAPGIALGYEPPEKNTMQRKPYDPKESIFSRGVGSQILWVGSLVAAISLIVGFIFYHSQSQGWQTMIFTTLTFCQMQFALSVRYNKDSIFSKSLLSNKIMLFTVIVTFLLQLALIYIPFLQPIFKTVPLSGMELLVCFLASFVVTIGIEIQKIMLRRKIIN